MLVSDSKDGREETFRGGRGGALEGLRYMMKRRGDDNRSASWLQKLQSQWIQRAVKELSSAKQESGRI